MDEIWKDVKGFEGLYKISSWGRVFSVRNNKLRSLKEDKDGYKTVGLYFKSKQTGKLVHRLVLDHFIERPTPAHECNHKDGDRGNNKLSNLEWVTRSENIRHSFENLGRNRRPGHKNPNSKLTPESVKTIRSMMGIKTQKQLAKEHMVSISQIARIQYGKAWANNALNHKP